MTEDEIAGRHHRLNRHEFEQALGVGDGQGILVCCSPRGHKDSDTTEQFKLRFGVFSWMCCKEATLGVANTLG